VQYIKVPGPSFTQWFSVQFWGGLFRGDVGQTYGGDDVIEVVLSGARHTLPIVFGTLLVSVTLALLITAILAWLPFPSLRGAIKTSLLLLSITPVFILAFVLQSQGVLNIGTVTPMILLACVAALTVGDSNLGEMLLQFETELRNLRERDYIHAARLRGASEFKHMLPGLLLPISSISASKVAFLLGAVVIVEFLWGVPGLGDASLDAAKKGDALLLVTLTVLITGVVALVALVRDVLEILIDPRLRRSAEDGG
jgi:ABC-type dipeptide/oligopeptide/nickel transport system permease component